MISRIMQIEEGVLFFISCESPNSISVLYPSVLFRRNFQTLKSFSPLSKSLFCDVQ